MSNTSSWYSRLRKPSWSPPGWLFGPVWAVLYIIITLTFSTVFYKAFIGQWSWLVTLPFVLNLIFNFAFTPLQFGLQNNLLAAIDIVLILGTLIWALVLVWSHAHWIVYANIPYLLWVTFATTLQFAITYLNWK
jgi:tryptophan-rich sensory protein